MVYRFEAGAQAATRAGLTLRVVLVGAESTGKTTLAEAQAAELRRRTGAWGAGCG